MTRILVTGVSGLLGLNLVHRLVDRAEIYGVLRRERPAPGMSLPFHPLFADLSDENQAAHLLDTAQPEVVFHCAAMTNIDYCETHSAEASHLNARIPEVWAAACAARGVRFVHLSTDAVFDGTQEQYCEEDTPHPLNVYGWTKLDGERRVAQANPDALIARVNFYGWSFDGGRSLSEYFFNNLSAGHAVRGFTNITFCPLFVNDLVDLLQRLDEARVSGLLHVVSSECLSKYDFGVRLAQRFGFDAALIAPTVFRLGDLRAQRSEKLHLSSGLLAKILGEPSPGIVEPLDRFYQQYCQSYPTRLRALLTR